MRTQIFPATWDAQQREGEVIQIVDEAVNGVRVVKAFGQEHRELERVTDSSEDALRLADARRPADLALPAAAAGDPGARPGRDPRLRRLAGPARQDQPRHLPRLHHLRRPARLADPPARRAAGDRPAGAGRGRADLPAARPRAGDRRPARRGRAARSRGDIDFDEVGFGYDERRAVLDGFDLHIEGGGAGRDRRPERQRQDHRDAARLALLRARPRRRPGRRPRRARRSPCTRCARQIGVVFEESFLFSDSVRANIAYGRPGASDAEIEAAARVAQAHDFVEALPRGYDSVVGERGLTLSGGQRQRIALARARPPGPADPDPRRRDERRRRPHRGGDQRGPARRCWPDRTTLLVAHRRSTLHLADRVVVLDEGRVIDEGTHDELAARSRHLSRPPDRARRGRRRGGRGPGRGARPAGRAGRPPRPGAATAPAVTSAPTRTAAASASARPTSAAGSANLAAPAAGR